MPNQLYSHHVVVSDPRHRVASGTIVSLEFAADLEPRGCVILPCDPSTMYRGGADSYALRMYGEGLAYDQNRASRAAALRLLLTPHRTNRVWWAALVRPLRAVDPVSQGKFRFVADASAGQQFVTGGLGAVELPVHLSERLPPEGHVVRGMSQITPSVEGELAAVLHGIADNCRVVWLAATVTE